ncbi:helix-turn-helix domain-containing protein [Clostridioides difficile]|nr:helix-turn-helix domain-containing protein [Clostridioides difficile]
MPTKGEQTKQFIIDTSIMLFSEKGYSNVTMKDICEACNLSRGGLIDTLIHQKKFLSVY